MTNLKPIFKPFLVLFCLYGVLFSQDLFVGISDRVLTKKTSDLLRDIGAKGVIIMSHNVFNHIQLKLLIEDLRGIRKDMIIAVDQEGGKVARLNWLKNAHKSQKYIGDLGLAQQAYRVAYERGLELKKLGIDLVLGPVADVAESEESFMYERSFGSNYSTVALFVKASVLGYHDAGIMCAIKHFPGHGATTNDSHRGPVTINKPKIELRGEDFLPFMGGILAEVDYIMLGHIINTNLSSHPATQAKEYVKILRDMGFRGKILTDDLNMLGKDYFFIDWGINLTLEPLEKIRKKLNEN